MLVGVGVTCVGSVNPHPAEISMAAKLTQICSAEMKQPNHSWGGSSGTVAGPSSIGEKELEGE